MNQNTKSEQLPFQPTRNNLLLERIADPEKVGSIFVPDSFRKPVNQGSIVALGATVSDDSLKVGHIVVFPMHVEHNIEVGRRKFIIINEDDILLHDLGYFASLQKGEAYGKKTTKES